LENALAVILCFVGGRSYDWTKGCGSLAFAKFHLVVLSSPELKARDGSLGDCNASLKELLGQKESIIAPLPAAGCSPVVPVKWKFFDEPPPIV
jgi:hypothetical protein